MTFSFAVSGVWYCSNYYDTSSYGKFPSNQNTGFVKMDKLTTSFEYIDGFGGSYNSYSGQSMLFKKSSDNKTIYWYSRYYGGSGYAPSYLDTSGHTYYFLGMS